MKSKKLIDSSFVMLAAILWSSMGVFSRHFNAMGLHSFEIAQLRITIGLLCVGGYLLIFHRDMLKIKLRDIWCFIGTGIISLLFFSCCYFTAIELTSLATAGVLLYTAPTFVMIMSLFLFKEKLTFNKVLALVLSFVGCILVSGLGAGSVNAFGILMGVGSGFFYALYSIFGRYAINRGYSSWTIVFYTFLFCASSCAFITDWSLLTTSIADQDFTVWFWIIGIGLITGFLPYIFYSMGLERMESSKASILASLEPVGGALFGIFVFKEYPSILAVIGICLVLSAIVVLSVKKKDKKA